jgi:PAS domain S-box-containing protein
VAHSGGGGAKRGKRAAPSWPDGAAAPFQAMAESIDQMIWSARPDGFHDYYNRRWYEYTGVAEGSTDGEAWNGMFHPEDRERAWSVWRRSLATGEPYGIEYRLRHRTGTYRWVLGRAQPVRDEAGAILRWYGTCTDIHDLKLAQEALGESEARFRAMADSAPAPVWVTNAEGIEFANQAYLELTGLPMEAVLGAGWMDIVHPDDVAAVLARRAQAWEEKGPYTFEARFRRHDGSWRLLHASCKPRPAGPGGFVGYVGLATDITEQRAAEARLRESETRYRVALSAGSLGAWSWDAATDLVTLSEEAAALFGVPPGPLAKWSDLATLIVREDAARTAEAIGRSLETRSDYSVEYRVTRPEGGQIWLNTVARPICDSEGRVTGMIGAVGDVTARREAEAKLRELNETLEQRVAEEIGRRAEAEEALRQAQKMETLGQLTGGVAHDFNNLLQIVRGNLEIVARNLPEEAERLRRATDNALRGTERAAILTQRLLAFSRRQPLAPRPVDLNKLVASMSDLLHRTLGETIVIETRLADGLWRIEADPNQLENSILNLAVNARDAMGDGGRLTVETANVRLAAGEARLQAEMAPGQYVVVRVADTGAGMDAETAGRAFEPFFTTKDVGKGTGLGLSMVYGFARQSGGQVEIASEPGRGTCVALYFPRLAASAAQAEAEADAPTVPAARPGETILVCEDDDDVRAYSLEVLRELGYAVLEAADGAAAVAVLEGLETRIDLLFTDVVLPGGMTGEAVAARARALRPDLPILFTTGYARQAIARQGRLDPDVQLIAKPFTYADLAGRIRELLDTAAAGG